VLFESGQGVCLGCSCERNAKMAARVALQLIRRVYKQLGLEHNLKLLNARICNLVMRLSLPFPVNLELMHSQNSLQNDFNCYNCEVFPG